jgi:hypothetical protein
VGTPEGKRPLGRPRRMWEDNIKTNLRETKLGGMDWIDLAQNRDRWMAIVNMVLNLRVTCNVWKVLSSCAPGGFSNKGSATWS